MRHIPAIINIPTINSSLDIFTLLNSGSSIDVNKVSDDKHTMATDTLDALIEPKNKTQCKPTIPPVKKSVINVFLVI
jgi:hypothetical protein